MYFNLYMNALSILGNISMDEYLSTCDITSLFDCYDEDEVILLRGIEGYIVGNYYKNNELINKIRNQIYDAFISNPYKYFDSFLFDDLFIKNNFSFLKVKKIKKIMKRLEFEANNIINNGYKNDFEKHFLMKYLKKHININDEFQKKLVGDILNKKISDLDNEEYNFLCSYVSSWVLAETGNENINISLFVSNFSLDRDDAGYQKCNCIMMRILDDEYNIPFVIKCVCHETRHCIQRKMYKDLHFKDSKVGLDYLEFIYMSNLFYEYNYYFASIEYDAELYGVNYALKFLSSFDKKSDLFFDDLYLSLKPYEFTMQCNGREFAECSKVSNFDMIVSNRSDLLDLYPILRKIYDNNGNKLSFEKMMQNDFSVDDNLGIFYDFIFDYIQKGALDTYETVNFKNIFMIYEKVILKVLSMFSGSVDDLLLIDYSLNLSDIDEIYVSEVAYYFSFLTKVSKYLYKYSSKFDDENLEKYISYIDLIVGKLDSFLNSNFKKNDFEFLNKNYSELLYIYNNFRFKEVQEVYKEWFEVFVPKIFWETVFVDNIILKDYVCNVLPLYSNYSDISYVDVSLDCFNFYDYIISLVSDYFGYDIKDILIFLDYLRIPDLDEHDLFLERFNDLTAKYEDNLDFKTLLDNVLVSVNMEYLKSNTSDFKYGISK